MKKAKIMLSTIAMIAVVGGALAFKAQKHPGLNYYTYDGSTCSLTSGFFQTAINPLLPSPVTITSATFTQDPDAVNCLQAITVYAEQ